MEVNGLLRVEPELGGGAEGRGELQGHFGRHRAAAVDDPVDHFDIASEMVRQMPLGHAERDQELLAKDLAGRSRLPAS